MGVLRGIRNLLWEIFDAQRLLVLPREKRRVVIYGEDRSTWGQMQGYLETLMEAYACDLVYVSSDADDPLFTTHHPRMQMFYVNHSILSIIPRLNSDICVFTVPDLGQLHVDRPKPESCALYLFHSLNSFFIIN